MVYIFKNLWSQKKVEMKICHVSTKIWSQFEEWSQDTFHHYPKTVWELQWASVRKQMMSSRTLLKLCFGICGDVGEASILKDIVPLLFYSLFFWDYNIITSFPHSHFSLQTFRVILLVFFQIRYPKMRYNIMFIDEK